MSSSIQESSSKEMNPKEWNTFFNNPSFIKEYSYTKNDLGSTYTKTNTTIKLWAPTASKVSISLYKTGNEKDNDIIESLPMIYTSNGIWIISLQGDYKNIYYTYSIEVNGTVNITNDPYNIACGVNGKRSMIIDLNDTNPPNWDKDNHVFYPLDKTFIYEIHIKDFSASEGSGIPKEHRGKYLAFTYPNTCYNNDPSKPTCMNYLKYLGITTVQIMPCYDYGSVDEEKDNEYNWGYDPINYNVPEGSYSANPNDGTVRVREFKQMIQAFHKEGISVIMDVVYNHTYTFRENNLNKTCPYYFHRTEPDGTLCNGSGCGNDTACEREMMRRFIINSVLYWVNEYHIDGFRFDLMALLDVDLMNEIASILDEQFGKDKIIIYGEPWSCNKTHLSKAELKLAQKENVNLFNQRIGFFHDELRNAIKGSDFDFSEKGILFYPFTNEEGNIKAIENFKNYFIGKINEKIPSDNVIAKQLINYISCHDNYTLWDRLVYSEFNPKEKDPIFFEKNDKLIKLNKLGASMIMLSFGVPFMLSGEEGGRTKQGNGNSYNLPIELNQIDWGRVYQFEDLLNYYRELISLRKELNNFYQLKRFHYYNLSIGENAIGYLIKRFTTGKYKEIIIIFNIGEKEIEYEVNGEWIVLLNGSNKNKTKKINSKDKFLIDGKTAGVIGRE